MKKCKKLEVFHDEDAGALRGYGLRKECGTRVFDQLSSKLAFAAGVATHVLAAYTAHVHLHPCDVVAVSRFSQPRMTGCM